MKFKQLMFAGLVTALSLSFGTATAEPAPKRPITGISEGGEPVIVGNGPTNSPTFLSSMRGFWFRYYENAANMPPAYQKFSDILFQFKNLNEFYRFLSLFLEPSFPERTKLHIVDPGRLDNAPGTLLMPDINWNAGVYVTTTLTDEIFPEPNPPRNPSAVVKPRVRPAFEPKYDVGSDTAILFFNPVYPVIELGNEVRSGRELYQEYQRIVNQFQSVEHFQTFVCAFLHSAANQANTVRVLNNDDDLDFRSRGTTCSTVYAWHLLENAPLQYNNKVRHCFGPAPTFFNAACGVHGSYTYSHPPSPYPYGYGGDAMGGGTVTNDPGTLRAASSDLSSKIRARYKSLNLE